MSLDKSKIKPVPITKTLLLVNNFISNTAEFFNSFAETIEKKITKVSNKITEVEILLAMLEAKLNSVSGLEASSAPAPSSAPAASIPPSTAEASTPAPPAATAGASEAESASEAAPPAASTNIADSPEYAPFFKLLKVGVPMFVVQAKVAAAGLDPSVLESFTP